MHEIPEEDLTLLRCICQAIFDKKGFNILTLDLRNLDVLADYFIIAEGSVQKHVQALAQAISYEMLELGQKPLYVEGKREGDWIVIDYYTIIIHLFVPEVREKYELEQLWQDAKIVDVPINVGAENFKRSVYE
jgi:ribosome-associated protein